MKMWLALLGGFALCAIALTAQALATPPGENGRIAFTRHPGRSDDDGSIFTMAANGRRETRVTTAPAGANDVQPDWSPDGSRLLFERQYDSKPYEVFTVKPDGSELTQIDPGCPPGIPATEICEESAPDWSPDGAQIAFGWTYGKLRMILGEETIEVAAVATMAADGSNVRQLTQLVRPTHSEDVEPAWSPDGRRIAFVRLNITAKPRGRTAIYVVNVDGSGLTRLTSWSLNAQDHPDWSPDGREILFRSEPTPVGFVGDLYTVHPDGAGLRRLTHFKEDTEVLSSSFSPDGRSIVFSKTGKAGTPDLFTMRSDGSRIKPLTRTPVWDSAPDWGSR
jgi:TolB protein